jgi:hypothetical protein
VVAACRVSNDKAIVGIAVCCVRRKLVTGNAGKVEAIVAIATPSVLGEAVGVGIGRKIEASNVVFVCRIPIEDVAG